MIQKVRRDSPSGLRPAETSVSPRRVKEADLDFPVQFVNYQKFYISKLSLLTLKVGAIFRKA
jgi:hypothetical protein